MSVSGKQRHPALLHVDVRQIQLTRPIPGQRRPRQPGELESLLLHTRRSGQPHGFPGTCDYIDGIDTCNICDSPEYAFAGCPGGNDGLPPDDPGYDPCAALNYQWGEPFVPASLDYDVCEASSSGDLGGGGHADPSAAPLICNFTAYSAGLAQAGVGQNGYGWFTPVSLTFAASGGNGIYTWSGQQTEVRFGYVTYANGTSESLSATVNEAVLFGNGKTMATSTTTGPTATAFDAPGLNRVNPTTNQVLVKGFVARDYSTTVTVSSGGQTVIARRSNGPPGRVSRRPSGAGGSRIITSGAGR